MASTNDGTKPTPDSVDSGKARQSRRRGQQRPVIVREKFAGKCDELKGHIYDCSDARQADLFTKTTNEIAEYVGKNYRHGADLKVALEKQEAKPTFAMPNDPDEKTATKTDIKVWELEIQGYVKRKDYLVENIQKAYSLIIGQCTDVMRARLEADDDFAKVSQQSDSIALLKLIKKAVFNFQSHKYPAHAIHAAKRRLYLFSQDRVSTLPQYLEKFQNYLDVIKHSGGAVGREPELIVDELKAVGLTRTTATNAQLTTAGDGAQQKYLAVTFLLSADRNRFGKLVEEIENDYLKGEDHYPKTLTAAYNLLISWKQDNRNHMRVVGPANDGVSFAHIAGSAAADTTDPPNLDSAGDGTALATSGQKKIIPDINTIKCYNCNKLGHYSSSCPDKQTEPDRPGGVNMLNTDSHIDNFDWSTLDLSGFTFMNAGNEQTSPGDAITAAYDNLTTLLGKDPAKLRTSTDPVVPPHWILLDNQSTVDVFYNPQLLTNIRQADGHMDIHCNAGVTTTNLIGDLPGYDRAVWFHPNGIANILSLSRVKDRHRVTYDSNDGNKFVIHKRDGSTREFHESTKGLYYLDVTKGRSATALVITVADKKSNYSERDYSRAQLARRLQNSMNRPSTRDLLYLIDHNLLPNCPVTRADILAAEDIFGPNLGSLKGKTTRRKPDALPPRQSNIPIHLLARYKDVTLCIDVMFVNGIPFLMTISLHIKFGTAEMIKNKKTDTLLASIKQVVNQYAQRGFRVTVIRADGEFGPLRNELAALHIILNVASRGEHVPDIERYIRTSKERTRCTYNMLPFDTLPGRLIVEMVYTAVFWLNMFPTRKGITKNHSPRSIITGTTLDYKKHCQLEFGEYVQTHEEHNNTMVTRTTGAIALRPTGNEQGGHYFLSLTSGRRLNRTDWTPLPMPAEVIARVNAMGKSNPRGLQFLDRDGALFPDDSDHDDDDSDYNPDDNPDSDDDDSVSAESAGVTDNENEPDDNEPDDTPNEDTTEPEPDPETRDAADATPPPTLHTLNEEEHNEPEDVTPPPNEHDNDDIDESIQDIINDEMDAKYGTRSTRYDLRTRKRRKGYLNVSYAVLNATLSTLQHIVMTQYNVKKGLSLFGQQGIDAVLKELEQLHIRRVMQPVDPDKMTREEKRATLHYLMFLKQKRCGRIKGRGCADGRKQRLTMSKHETSSPTVALEALFLSCIIDALEGRDVATSDIPGAFMQADMEGVVHMKLEGTMAELLKNSTRNYIESLCAYERDNQLCTYN